MMDLIGEYIVLFVLLFVVNISLLLNDFKVNNKKVCILSFVYALAILCSSFIALYLSNFSVDFISLNLVSYYAYILAIITIFMFVFTGIYLINWKRLNQGQNTIVNKKVPFFGIFLSSLILVFILSFSWKSDFSIYVNSFGLAILSLIIMLLVYKISKIFYNAKRSYSVVVGEYMFLESILIGFLALTFDSVRNLDYSTFTSFLILTPTYQILYLIIAIVAIFILGIMWNEHSLKNLKRK